jgi:hypothetical protein
VSSHASPKGASPKAMKEPIDTTKTILNMQDDIKWMKISLEKMVPAE